MSQPAWPLWDGGSAYGRRAWPSLRGRPMPPLQLNDEEMNVVLTLAGPIGQQLRPQFLQEVAQELEAKPQAGEIGEGSVHRVGRVVQRRFSIALEASCAEARSVRSERQPQHPKHQANALTPAALKEI